LTQYIFKGKYYLMSKNGKIEKTVDAHKGAVICCRWSYDGTMLVTGTNKIDDNT
jgi:hypothetical protein